MQPDTALKIIALVSIGQHPRSGRVRRAEQDARALEMGLRLAPRSLTVVHAGDPQQPVLRGYAGMGLERLNVLRLEPQFDIVPALLGYIQQQSPDIVLTGVRAESGESSGMVPYLLGEALGWPVIPRITDIVSITNGVAEVLLALPRGQRRAIQVALPFVASVDNAAAPARQTAYGPGVRAVIESVKAIEKADLQAADWQQSAARPRPKRLKVVKAKTAAERFKAATAKPQGTSGRILTGMSAAEQAQEIFNLLREEKVI